MEVVNYSSDRKVDWNEFVGRSINATFMFHREYMEYHADRFQDASVMVYYKDRPLALLPANREDDCLVSHGWLTFGGFLTGMEMTMPKMMKTFDAVESHLTAEGVTEVRYKAIPSIYHAVPTEGDRYALFRKGANRYRCDVSSAIFLPDRPDFKRNRRQMVDRAGDHGVTVREIDDYATYWKMLRETLGKHDVEPVHTVDEMKLLKDRFPENISLYGAYLDADLVSGAVVYESDIVARTQYIASTDRGDEIRATDYLLADLISDRLKNFRYFDFGISTEADGTVLNEGLSYYKETFGARSVVHDFYEWEIDT